MSRNAPNVARPTGTDPPALMRQIGVIHMYSVIERLPDGTERVIDSGLTLDQVFAYVAPEGSWAIAFVQE